jgi:hypothetical protein
MLGQLVPTDKTVSYDTKKEAPFGIFVRSALRSIASIGCSASSSQLKKLSHRCHMSLGIMDRRTYVLHSHGTENEKRDVDRRTYVLHSHGTPMRMRKGTNVKRKCNKKTFLHFRGTCLKMRRGTWTGGHTFFILMGHP